MNVEKAQWTSNGSRVNMSVPLTKVDQERRLVHGFASLDNVDSHDDIVTADASVRAFSRFRGNIREMHQPVAVGKMVGFKEDEFYDPNEGKFYRGVFVTAYVSKGAQDTWEKVLDGTLTGFSIGGEVVDATTEFDKSANKPIRYINDYELVELSLVDNPANQLANIFAIEKMADGEHVVKGEITTMDSATAFYCYDDDIAKVSNQESEACPSCGSAMKDIGWFEYGDDQDKSVKLQDAVLKYLASDSDDATEEGGVDVAKDTVEKSVNPSDEPIEVGEQGQAQTEVDANLDNAKVEDVEAPDPVAEVSDVEDAEKVEEVEEVSEVDDAGDDLTKMFEGFKNDIEKFLTGKVSDLSAAGEELAGKFDEFSKSVDERLTSLAKEHDKLSEKFARVADDVEKVEKNLNTLQRESAVKKSNDLGGSEGDSDGTLKKGASSESLWGGHFLGIDSLR